MLQNLCHAASLKSWWSSVVEMLLMMKGNDGFPKKIMYVM